MLTRSQVQSIRSRIDSKLEVFYKGKKIAYYNEEVCDGEENLFYFYCCYEVVCELDIEPWEITVPMFKL